MFIFELILRSPEVTPSVTFESQNGPSPVPFLIINYFVTAFIVGIIIKVNKPFPEINSMLKYSHIINTDPII